jgi:Zn-dependent protease with chaperone function
MRDGAGIFFDGATSARQPVSIELADSLLRLRDRDGMVLVEWPYAEIEQKSSPKDVLRLGLDRAATTARLEVRDTALAAEIDARALTVDRTGATDRRARLRVIGWSLFATLSLLVVAIFVVPNVAGRLAPYVPTAIEQRLGNAANMQVRAMLDTAHLGDRLTCGTAEAERKGKAALDGLVTWLARTADLREPIEVNVVRKDVPNAFALPGGHIYIYQGLLDKAENANELAGVIAHEMGHVAHRDGMRSVLQGAGLSFLFGMLLGDFVGGGAVVIAAKTLIESSYSRSVEAAADAYGVHLVAAIGGKPTALADILARIESNHKPGMRIWVDHPQVEDRVREINRLAPPTRGSLLLDDDNWAALKHICSGS